MKFQLDKEQTEYVLRDSYVSISDFVNTLSDEQEKQYLSIYASVLLEKIAETDAQAVETAKDAIVEYFDYQELHDDGYWYPNSDFTKDDEELLEQCDANSIDYDKWEWDESALLGYIVDSSWTHCSRDYGLVTVNNESIYFDRDQTKNERIATVVEELAKKILFKINLENNLEVKSSKVEKKVKI